jgi:hypothetical protein
LGLGLELELWLLLDITGLFVTPAALMSGEFLNGDFDSITLLLRQSFVCWSKPPWRRVGLGLLSLYAYLVCDSEADFCEKTSFLSLNLTPLVLSGMLLALDARAVLLNILLLSILL